MGSYEVDMVEAAHRKLRTLVDKLAYTIWKLFDYNMKRHEEDWMKW